MKKDKVFIRMFSVLSAISLIAMNSSSPYLAALPDPTVVTAPGEATNNVKGYVAGGQNVYDIEIYWNKDMTFVYDKGKYNSGSGQIESSMQTSDTADSVTVDHVEKGGAPGKANQWYGFDGINNRIVVLNKSNVDVYTKFATNKQADNPAVNNVEFKLYKGSQDQTKLVETASGSGTYVPESFKDEEDRVNRFGLSGDDETEVSKSTALKIEKTPEAGTAKYQKVFLNVAGTPSDSLANDKASAATIGTITVNISDNDGTSGV